MKLTIGMSCYDDYDGVWFTIQSILMYHRECIDDINFVVIDGNPESKHGKACEKLISTLTNTHGNNGLYVKNVTWAGTASREYIFQYAKTPYVLCLDSHVQVVPGAIDKLIKFYDENPDCTDLIHGPLLDDNGKIFATEMVKEWSYNMYGKWSHNPTHVRSDHEYEVDMMGLGLFSCVKKNWLGFNRKFTGFGGEEGYIHDKYKLAGRRNIAFPWLQWNHRFSRPNGVPYRNDYIDRIKNYFIGRNELNQPVDDIINYYSTENKTPGQERTAINSTDLRQLHLHLTRLESSPNEPVPQPSASNTRVESNSGIYEEQITSLKSRIIELEMKLMEQQLIPVPKQPVETVQLDQYLTTQTDKTPPDTSDIHSELEEMSKIDSIQNAEIMFQQRLFQQPVEESHHIPPPVVS